MLFNIYRNVKHIEIKLEHIIIYNIYFYSISATTNTNLVFIKHNKDNIENDKRTIMVKWTERKVSFL